MLFCKTICKRNKPVPFGTWKIRTMDRISTGSIVSVLTPWAAGMKIYTLMQQKVSIFILESVTRSITFLITPRNRSKRNQLPSLKDFMRKRVNFRIHVTNEILFTLSLNTYLSSPLLAIYKCSRRIYP